MGHSTILISLSLVTLLCGLSIAAYQLWSAETARQDDRRSALAARYGGKSASNTRRAEQTSLREEPRIAAPPPLAEANASAVAPPQAERAEAATPKAEARDAEEPDAQEPDADALRGVRGRDAESPKRSPRAPRRKPKPDLTPNA